MSTEQEKQTAKEYNKQVGAALRAQIAYEGKSIAQLSRETGIEYVTLGRYLKGERDIPIPILYRCVLHLKTTPTGILKDVAIRQGWLQTPPDPNTLPDFALATKTSTHTLAEELNETWNNQP